MNLEGLNWRTNQQDKMWWTLSAYVTDTITGGTSSLRRLFEVHYFGRTQVAFSGSRERWKVYDRRYWIDDPEDIPEFDSVHEAKDWVDAVVRLET